MGSYVMARGLRTYYEEWGAGDPVVLLHGGGVTADSWYGQAPALAARYRVLAPERRGHGRTPDVEGPYSYDGMADDTAAFMDEVGAGPAHVIGWSDGAVVALHLALRRPDLVAKLVVIGSAVTDEGATEAARALNVDDEEGRETLTRWFLPLYEPLSPDGPEHFPVFLGKLTRMWSGGTGLELADLARIAAPTLVMQGDDDGVRAAHSAEMAATLPEAQLAVVPGTSHALPLEKPDLVSRLLLDFLADDHPPKLMPMSGPRVQTPWD